MSAPHTFVIIYICRLCLRVSLFFSEDAGLITALQDELKNLKEEMVQLKSTPVSVPLTVLHDSTSVKNELH